MFYVKLLQVIQKYGRIFMTFEIKIHYSERSNGFFGVYIIYTSDRMLGKL